jgi:hypothetical protein
LIKNNVRVGKEEKVQPEMKIPEDTFDLNSDDIGCMRDNVRTRPVVDCAVVLTELNVLIGKSFCVLRV